MNHFSKVCRLYAVQEKRTGQVKNDITFINKNDRCFAKLEINDRKKRI